MNDSFASPLRKRIIFVFIFLIGSLMIFQLVKMQIIQHEEYLERSNINSIKGIEEEPPRGVFLDRNMEVMVSNKPAFTMQIIPSEYDKNLSPLINKVINEDSNYVNRVLKLNRVYSPYIPRKVKRDVDFRFVAWYEENQSKLPGVQYTVDIQRDYSFGINGSHVFGYTKEISPAMLEKHKDNYSLGDYIGHKGLEKTYEKYLRGKKGVTYYVVDSRQRRIGRYQNGKKDIMPEKGHDLILTLDADAQKIAEAAFQGKKGGLVAIEPSTGEVIAYVSSPNYDLTAFSTVTTEETWRFYMNNPDKPLFNRAIMSMFPPGSTFKMLLGIAALEMGVIDEETRINCAGGYQYGNRFYKCHGGSHGPLNLRQAIEKSCNAFFYQLILRVGLDKWSEYVKMFGFGSRTGIDLDGEIKGLVPSKSYYDRVYGKGKWSNGLLLNISIGQGEVGTTPAQLAQYVSLIANNGRTKVPHLVRGYLNKNKKDIVNFKYNDINVPVSQKTFNIIKDGMFQVVHGAGTATWLKIPNITMAGKTGTAQNPHGKDHALFIGFAPYENPQIAIAVMVENAGFGSTWAGPIARDVIKVYLEKKLNLPKTIKPDTIKVRSAQ